jgi:hypothetical protein
LGIALLVLPFGVLLVCTFITFTFRISTHLHGCERAVNVEAPCRIATKLDVTQDFFAYALLGFYEHHAELS